MKCNIHINIKGDEAFENLVKALAGAGEKKSIFSDLTELLKAVKLKRAAESESEEEEQPEDIAEKFRAGGFDVQEGGSND